MSNRDVAQAVIEEVAALVTADATMISLTQNEGESGKAVRFHHLWAPEDCEFPYLTCALALRATRETQMQVGTFTINAWDEGPSQDRVLAIRKRLMTLLPQRLIGADEFAARFYYDNDYSPSEPEVEVWRWLIRFEVRLWPTAEVAAMQARGL